MLKDQLEQSGEFQDRLGDFERRLKNFDGRLGEITNQPISTKSPMIAVMMENLEVLHFLLI